MNRATVSCCNQPTACALPRRNGSPPTSRQSGPRFQRPQTRPPTASFPRETRRAGVSGIGLPCSSTGPFHKESHILPTGAGERAGSSRSRMAMTMFRRLIQNAVTSTVPIVTSTPRHAALSRLCQLSERCGTPTSSTGMGTELAATPTPNSGNSENVCSSMAVIPQPNRRPSSAAIIA